VGPGGLSSGPPDRDLPWRRGNHSGPLRRTGDCCGNDAEPSARSRGPSSSRIETRWRISNRCARACRYA